MKKIHSIYSFLLLLSLFPFLSSAQTSSAIEKQAQMIVSRAIINNSGIIQVVKSTKDINDKVFSININYLGTKCKTEVSSIEVLNAHLPLTWYELDENGNRNNPQVNPSLTSLTNQTTYLVEDYSKYTDTVFLDFNQTVTLSNVYPNPAKRNVQLDFSIIEEENVQLKIFDSLGRLFYNNEYTLSQGEDQVIIDLQHLSTGIYFIHSKTSCSEETRKLVFLDSH